MMNSKWTNVKCAIVIACVVCSCAKSTHTASKNAGSPVGSSDPSATSATSSVPPSAPSTTTATSVTNEATVAPPLVTEPSPFHLVGVGGRLMSASGALYLYDDARLVAEVVGDTVVNHPEYMGSYPEADMSEAHYVGGKWPDAAFVAETRPHTRSSHSILKQRAGKHWRQIVSTGDAEWIRVVKPWDRGRHLALVNSMGGYHKWQVAGGSPRMPPVSAVVTGDGESRQVQRPVDFQALPSGHLFAVGESTDWEQIDWFVERWAPRARYGTIEKLPNPQADLDMRINGLHVTAPDNAFVFGSAAVVQSGSKHDRYVVAAYMAHFDGKSWTPRVLPLEEEIVSLTSDGDELWFATNDGVYRQLPTDVNPRAVVLPDASAFVSYFPEGAGLTGKSATWGSPEVQVHPGHDVWFIAELTVGEKYLGWMVFRNRPHPRVWRGLEEGADYHETVQQYSPLRPDDGTCYEHFVLLYSVTRATPANYDYPATRKALTGHEEFSDVVFAETEERGRCSFGAFTTDSELSRNLVEVIQREVKGSNPIAVCRSPKKVRLLQFDLKTGAVLKNEPLP